MISDEELARSHQMALDMQMAYDLQEREVAALHEQRTQQSSNGGSLFSASSSLPPLIQGRAIPSASSATSSRAPSRASSSSAAAAATPIENDGNCTGFTADHMLYVPCEVEGRLVEMLVDSGASSSAISTGEMKRLNLQNKLNTRFAGKAVGCGSANVIGIVENVLVSIGHAEFRLFFLVLETEHPLMILGLDQMRKFKCIIDLEENKLVFGGKGGVEVQFLPSYDTSGPAARQQGRRGDDCTIM